MLIGSSGFQEEYHRDGVNNTLRHMVWRKMLKFRWFETKFSGFFGLGERFDLHADKEMQSLIYDPNAT